MLPAKFEANPTLGFLVRHTSFSLFPLESSCSNDDYCTYTVIDFLANQSVFPNMVTHMC